MKKQKKTDFLKKNRIVQPWRPKDCRLTWQWASLDTACSRIWTRSRASWERPRIASRRTDGQPSDVCRSSVRSSSSYPFKRRRNGRRRRWRRRGRQNGGDGGGGEGGSKGNDSGCPGWATATATTTTTGRPVTVPTLRYDGGPRRAHHDVRLVACSTITPPCLRLPLRHSDDVLLWPTDIKTQLALHKEIF